jgi:type I restriction enzyme S subunit
MLMDVTSVKRIHQADWQTNGIPFFRARDIVAASKNKKIDEPIFISFEKYEEYSTQSGKVTPGDLLVTGVGSIGVPYLITDNSPLYFKDGNIIWFKNSSLEPYFFYYQFKATKIQNYIISNSGTGTVGTYTIQSGKNTPIFITGQEEQAKIGSILSSVDKLIASNQRNLNKPLWTHPP